MIKRLPETEGLTGETQFYVAADYSDGRSIDLIAVAKNTDAVSDPEVNVESHWILTCEGCGDGVMAAEQFYN